MVDFTFYLCVITRTPTAASRSCLLLTAKPLPRRRQWHPAPALLPGKSTDGGAWWAAVHGVARSRTRLSDFTFTFQFPALEKEMATHSSVLAWRITGTGEPGGLPSGVAQSRTRLKWFNSSSSIPLYICTISSLSIHLLVDTKVVAMSWL